MSREKGTASPRVCDMKDRHCNPGTERLKCDQVT